MMHPSNGTGGGSKTKRTVSVAGIASDKTDKKTVAIRKLSPPKEYKLMTWNVDNFTRLLRVSLEIECQAHILNDSFPYDAVIRRPTTFAGPVLGED
jgi:hypothetical protein